MRPQIYFPNLNGLRFVAAAMVISYHIEYAKKLHNLPNLFSSNSYGVYLGGLGVTLFFCLSGFLITYILLAEKDQFGSIDLKNFYIRRTLRIWPLYYLVIFLAFVVLYNSDFFWISSLHEKASENYIKLLLFYLFLIPNFLIYNSMPYATQTWSIGVEEQFYLLWPVVIKSVRRIDLLLYGLLFVFFILYGLVDFVLPRTVPGTAYKIVRYLLTNCRFDCMVVGAIAAYSLYNNKHPKLFEFIYRKNIQILMYIATIVLLTTQPLFHGHGHMVYSLFFTSLIINLATNKNSIISLENKVLDYLGKISYGLYMLHPIAIYVSLKGILELGLEITEASGILFNVVLYISSFLLTIVLAAFSYSFFEKTFLKMKSNYSTIETGDSIRKQSI